MVTPAAKRDAIAHLRTGYPVSERHACKTLAVERSLIRYKSRCTGDDGIRRRLRDLSAQRKRFGYRGLHILLGREGVHINHKKLRRLYREEGLSVCKRRDRKRAVGTRLPLAGPSHVNESVVRSTLSLMLF